MSTKVSVLVPSYNYASKLPRCIESVLAQDHPNFELVISDDASTDDSDLVIRRYSDARIRYERQPQNLGMVPNWRRCVALSTGEYLLLLGADDYLRPGMLRACTDVLDTDREIAFCHTAAEFFLDDGRIVATTGAFQRSYVRPGLDLLEPFLKGKRAVNSAVVFRRECWDELQGWSPDYRNCMDLDLWFRMLLRWKAAYVGKILVGFRAHDVSDAWKIMQAEEDLRFLHAMFERLPASHAHLRSLAPALESRLRQGWLATLAGLTPSDARDAAIRALGGSVPVAARATGERNLAALLKRRGSCWLAKLPDGLRYRLGDWLRLAG